MAFAGTKKKSKTKKSSKPKAPPGRDPSKSHKAFKPSLPQEKKQDTKSTKKNWITRKDTNGTKSENQNLIKELDAMINKDGGIGTTGTPNFISQSGTWHPGVGRDESGYLPSHPLYDGGKGGKNGGKGGKNGGNGKQGGDNGDETLTPEEKAEKKALEASKGLVEWWEKNGHGYRKYGDRRKFLSSEIRNTKEAVAKKIQDKLNKGYYKIVNQTVRMKQADGTYKMVENVPMIVTNNGIPVNPYSGHIVSTQSTSDQGGAYQNNMARALGVDESQAGVFSKEYQRGSGLGVFNMKPQHALRLLMKKNSKAFEEFFQMNKGKKGFNPFSASAINAAMGAIMNMITGPEALQVGNNLERAGWGKAIKNEDTGDYTIKLTKKGAQGWSDSFNFDTVNIGDKTFSGFTSPEAITKDQSKGWLSEMLGTKKYFDSSGVSTDKPIDLTNLIDQGGYFQGSEFQGFSGQKPGTVNFMTPQEQAQLVDSSGTGSFTSPNAMFPNQNFNMLDPNLNPDIPFSNTYSYPDVSTLRTDNIPGTPSSWVNPEGTTSGVNSLVNYPTFTPEGFKIGSYNPTRDYSGGTGQNQTGDGSQTTTKDDDDDTTDTYGNLTFDVYGRPIKKYDYTGGPEQLYLGGGWKKDGQYIGSPWGFKEGGIANFKPYGY